MRTINYAPVERDGVNVHIFTDGRTSVSLNLIGEPDGEFRNYEFCSTRAAGVVERVKFAGTDEQTLRNAAERAFDALDHLAIEEDYFEACLAA